MNATPFHPGELQVQTRVGVRERVEPFAQKVIRSFMPDQHRAFYGQLPFVVAAARDAAGRPWATLLTGKPGFIVSPAEDRLELSTRVAKGDALEDALQPGIELGFLGIALESRRRNRVNGRLLANEHGVLDFNVDQSFGNCPRYITRRDCRFENVDTSQSSFTRHSRLDSEMQQWITKADTMFLATGYEGTGMDASHRGGEPGFVEVVDDHELVFPDYAGNNYFNSLGNLMMDSRIGLLFVDFERGNLLQLTGAATIDWDSDAVARYPDAQRLIRVRIEELVQLRAVLPLRWVPSANRSMPARN
jgi:predicted pyridoxine 5'-phosphate oxidase superfamily flavin-nucleotide-binding protein